MKVLICSNYYPPFSIGGAEIIAHEQAKELVRQGHEVRVFAGRHIDSHERHSLGVDVVDGIEVWRVALNDYDFSIEQAELRAVDGEAHFCRMLREWRPDVVHFHNLPGLSFALPTLAKTNGAVTVMTLHDHWGFCYKNTVIKSPGYGCTDYEGCAECLPTLHGGRERAIPVRVRRDYIKIALDAIDCFVSPSVYLADAYTQAGFEGHRFAVVSNGLDVNRHSATHKIAAPLMRFSYVGIFAKHKGVIGLIHAFAALRHPAHLNLVGTGPDEGEYRQLVVELGCSARVRFWGKVENREMGSVYAQTDVLVLPSIWRENQPVSITEAMAGGIPVIASDAGGIPELIQDGHTGLLFELGNVKALTRALTRAIEDRRLVDSMGQAARKAMAGNSTEASVRKLVSLYRAEYKPHRSAGLIIACIGDTFSPVSGDTIANEMRGNLDVRFVLSDWLTDSQWQSVGAVLCVDEKFAVAAALKASQYGVPCLLPAQGEAQYESSVQIHSYDSAVTAAHVIRRVEAQSHLRTDASSLAMSDVV